MPGKSPGVEIHWWVLPVARNFGKSHPLGFYFITTRGWPRWASSTLAPPGSRGLDSVRWAVCGHITLSAAGPV